MTNAPWSAEEIEILQSRRAAGKDWEDIAAELPRRTLAACKQRWFEMNRRARNVAAKPRMRRSEAKPNGRPSRRVRAEILADAMRQMPPDAAQAPRHTTITGAIFGDPLPGRSALDRMRGSSA